jgi:hypothetical protein
MQLYRFLTGPDDSSFCHRVTEALNKGWMLYGSPSHSYNAEEKKMYCGHEYSPDIKLGSF